LAAELEIEWVIKWLSVCLIELPSPVSILLENGSPVPPASVRGSR